MRRRDEGTENDVVVTKNKTTKETMEFNLAIGARIPLFGKRTLVLKRSGGNSCSNGNARFSLTASRA